MKVARTWQAMMLSERALAYPVATLEKALKKVDPDISVWFPAVSDGGMLDEASPYATYCFVLSPVSKALRRSWCVDKVLTGDIPEKELIASVGRVPPLLPGTRVHVIAGDLKGLEGEIRKVAKGICYIEIDLESGRRSIKANREDVERA